MLAIEKQAAAAAATESNVVKARFLKIGAASQYSSLGRTTIYELLNAAKIKSFKIGAVRLVDRESLDAFILSQAA